MNALVRTILLVIIAFLVLVRFVVQRTASYDKQRFPTDAVYYPTLTSTLQLVTCGGQFDTATGHYRSNIIVFATMRP